MFSQACVIPSVHGGAGVGFPAFITGHMTGGVCIQGGSASVGDWADPPPAVSFVNLMLGLFTHI